MPVGEIDTLYQTIYTGINNEYELIEKSFTIFPNPAAEQITLSCIIPHHLSEVKLLITDLTGRVISSNQIQGNPRELEIDISYLNNGSYLVSLDHNGHILASRKLMVVK
ncbi:MAG: T9SS type A sorting domain-containing protein [Bacteroidetes bacterium]|nr:T9SS type A sorting domain-containing protein [Bacteroidota bacterium]